MFAKKKEKVYSNRYVAVLAVRHTVDALKASIDDCDMDRKNQSRIRTMEGILSSMAMDFSRD